MMMDITVAKVQLYFNSFADSALKQETREKIWTVMSAVMRSALPAKHNCMTTNPCHSVELPAPNHAPTSKPFITAEQFVKLVNLIAGPYSTMVYGSALTGLRVSELAALRWKDVSQDSLTVDEGYCRGAFAPPKSVKSNRVIPVLPAVIARIESLKTVTVEVGGGRGSYQTFKVMRRALNPYSPIRVSVYRSRRRYPGSR